MDLFTLVARLAMDTSEYESKIGKSRGMMEKLSSSVSAGTIAMGTMIANGISKAVDVVADLGRSAIQNAADIAAEKAQFQAAFGELEAMASGAFKNIAKDTGVLSTRLQNVGTKAFSQFKGAGLDAVSALNSMDKYTRLAADAAAYYDMSIEDADSRLRSFLRGNTEAGDMIGLFTSETQRNNKALEVYGAKWLELNEAQKQMLMLNIADEIYQQNGAIGQAERESGEYTNVVGNLKEAWRQLTGVIGTPFKDESIPFFQKLTEVFGDDTIRGRVKLLADDLGRIANKGFTGAINLLDSLLAWSRGEEENGINDGIGKVSRSLGEVAKESFEQVTGFFALLLGGVDGNDDTMENITSFLNDVSTFVSENAWSIALIISSLIGLWAVQNPFVFLITALATLIANWNDVKNATQNTIDAVTNFFQTTFSDPFGEYLNLLSDRWDTLVGRVNAAIEAVKNFFGMNAEPEDPTINTSGTGTVVTRPGAGMGGMGVKRKARAVGLDYVPYDDYPANLHEGEAVLTKAEATDWRRGGANAAPVDTAAIAEAVGAAVREALSGVTFHVGERTFAQLVTETASRGIAVQMHRGRYAT